MIMMMNCFCGMVDLRKAFSIISSQDHCQRSQPSWISNTPRPGFEPAQNPSPVFVEWSCAVVITTTPRHHKFCLESWYIWFPHLDRRFILDKIFILNNITWFFENSHVLYKFCMVYFINCFFFFLYITLNNNFTFKRKRKSRAARLEYIHSKWRSIKIRN